MNHFDWKLAFSLVLTTLAVVLAVLSVFAVKALKQKAGPSDTSEEEQVELKSKRDSFANSV